jgi:hypothetical protein
MESMFFSRAGRPAKTSRRVSGGVEQGCVDAQLLDRHALHAGVGQARGHVPAGRHHVVEALVGLGPEIERRRLGPLAEMQGGQRRGVGVTEAHHRHAQGVAGIERRVAGHEDVAGLDHVGLQQPQHGLPLRQAGGHPVAVAERQAGGGHGHQAVGFGAGARARNHQGVAHVGAALGQPSPFGHQVALHAAGLGRVHHGGVDQVEARAPRLGQRGGELRIQPDEVRLPGSGDIQHAVRPPFDDASGVG